MVTNEELAGMKRRVDGATAGPWFNSAYHVAMKPDIDGGYPPNDASICETCDGEYIENYNKGDAEFIAHSRSDMPKLIAEVERMRTAITQLYKAYSRGKTLHGPIHRCLMSAGGYGELIGVDSDD